MNYRMDYHPLLSNVFVIRLFHFLDVGDVKSLRNIRCVCSFWNEVLVSIGVCDHTWLRTQRTLKAIDNSTSIARTKRLRRFCPIYGCFFGWYQKDESELFLQISDFNNEHGVVFKHKFVDSVIGTKLVVLHQDYCKDNHRHLLFLLQSRHHSLAFDYTNLNNIIKYKLSHQSLNFVDFQRMTLEMLIFFTPTKFKLRCIDTDPLSFLHHDIIRQPCDDTPIRFHHYSKNVYHDGSIFFETLLNFRPNKTTNVVSFHIGTKRKFHKIDPTIGSDVTILNDKVISFTSKQGDKNVFNLLNTKTNQIIFNAETLDHITIQKVKKLNYRYSLITFDEKTKISFQPKLTNCFTLLFDLNTCEFINICDGTDKEILAKIKNVCQMNDNIFMGLLKNTDYCYKFIQIFINVQQKTCQINRDPKKFQEMINSFRDNYALLENQRK